MKAGLLKSSVVAMFSESVSKLSVHAPHSVEVKFLDVAHVYALFGLDCLQEVIGLRVWNP